jgi:hypothetical protein
MSKSAMLEKISRRLETPAHESTFTMSDDEESDSDIDEEDTKERENGR